jgi:hypothetical protein
MEPLLRAAATVGIVVDTGKRHSGARRRLPLPDTTEAARMVIIGRLDAGAAARLAEVCDRGAAGELSRLELDLSGVTEATVEGVAAISRCLALRRRLPDGINVVVANDVGRRALLDSMINA